MKKIIQIVKNKISFYKNDLLTQSPEEDKKLFFTTRILKLLLIGWKQFVAKDCMQKASALTYYSLLSIVPVLAMVFGIAKGFGFDKILEQLLLEKFTDKKAILLQIFDFSNSLLSNTHGGMIAGVGLVVLFWSVMKVLNNVELFLNDIWEVKAQRTFARKLSDYFSIMFLAPVLLIISNSATIYISNIVPHLLQKSELLSHIMWLVMFALKLLPFSLVWFGFTFVYIIMPNTKVQFKSAFIGGVIAGIIFQIVQWVYIRFQIGVASYNAIYGSFAALPLFLVWLQISWFILMLGAVVSHIVQKGFHHEFDKDDIIISHEQKLALSFWITTIIVKSFEKGAKPVDVQKIAEDAKMSPVILKPIIARLEHAKIITRVYSTNKEIYLYQPACSTNLLSIQFVEQAINSVGERSEIIIHTSEFNQIKSLIKKRKSVLEHSEINILIKDL